MADGGRIGLEQLEQSLNLELTANKHELQALEKGLDDCLNDFGGGNKPRNVHLFLIWSSRPTYGIFKSLSRGS